MGNLVIISHFQPHDLRGASHHNNLWSYVLVVTRMVIFQDELDDVIGPEKPQLQHQSNMHLMNAVISEIQRYVNLVSINLPHSATQDVKFKGQSPNVVS